MLKIAVIASAGLALAGCGTAPPPANVTKQYMAEFVQPQADIFWKSAGAVSDENGTVDLAPTTDAGWQKTLAAASAMVAAGEKLQEAAYAEGKGPGWIKFSQGLVEIGKQAEAAARAKDADKVFEVGAYMYDVCSGCHQAYPAANEAESKAID